MPISVLSIDKIYKKNVDYNIIFVFNTSDILFNSVQNTPVLHTPSQCAI